MFLKRNWIVHLAGLAAIACLGSAAGGGTGHDAVTFTDARAQTEEFLRYEREIQLTPAQEKVKRDALLPLPAPCCSENSAYTCCCPCNLSRSVWGLSAYLIAEHDYDAAAVRAKVEEWLRYIAPDGHSGTACSERGCGRPFARDGCGGMSPDHLIW